VLAFVLDQSVQFAAKIDNGVDAELFELLNSLFLGLGTAVEKIVYPAEIRNAWNRDFLCKSGLLGWRRTLMPDAAAYASSG